MKKIFKELGFLNVVTLAAMSFLQALQCLIFIAATIQFIPYKKTDFVAKIFPVYLPEVRPEREMLLFRLFVIIAMAVMFLWVRHLRNHIDQEGLWRRYINYIIFSGCCIFVQIFFVFKVLVWGAPLWAVVMMYGVMIATVFAHIFWPEIEKVMLKLWERRVSFASVTFPMAWDFAFLVGMVVLLFPFQMDRVLGRMFVHDQFYHLDSMLMTPGWAHLKHLVLNSDITSQYSVGLPIVLSNILNLLHQFNYQGAVTLLIGLNLAYYAALYFFIVFWLGSRAVAVFGTLLAIKLQLFHWGVAPLVWQYPSATALRHLPDVIFFFAFWQYLQTQQRRWFYMSVVSVALSLCWMIDVGVYLMAALGAYLLLTQWKKVFIVVPAILFLAFCFLAILQPHAVLTPSFWQHQFEFAGLFVQGWGALPMTEGLKEKQYFAFIIGFMIPIFYAGNMVYSFLRKQYFTLFLSLYGLGLYHYFIHRSGVTSYYAVCIPLVLILCLWLKEILPQYVRKLAAIIMLPILMTSYLFTYYPNILNLSGLKWQEEVGYYQQRFDFKDDAAFIAVLTKPNERIAIISSFETKILMQANRPPFFYYSPLIESSLMDNPQARLTYLHTYDRLRKTIAQIEKEKPQYIFIEKKELQQQGQSALTGLVKHISQHYMPFKVGTYLIAYKRIGS